MTDTSEQFMKKLLDLNVPFAINIAKNAKTLVYSAGTGWEGKTKSQEHQTCSVWHAEVGKADSARQLTSGLFNDQRPAISPNGETVVFVSDRAKQGESSAIYALSLSGGEPYPITEVLNEQSIDGLKWSPDGEFLAYISADEASTEKKEKEKNKDDVRVWNEDWPYNRLRVMHFATKQVSTIVALEKHITDFDWHADGKSIAFSTQNTPDTESSIINGCDIYTVQSTGHSLRHIIHFPNAIQSIVYTGSEIHCIGFVTSVTSHGALTVYKISTEQESPIRVRIGHGDTDCSMALQKVGSDIACYVQHGLEDHIEMLGGKVLVNIPNAITTWAAAYPEDSDEVIIAFSKSDVNHPTEVYTTTASGGAFVKLSSHGAAFSKYLATSINVSCKTFDNTDTIEGVLHIPIEHAVESGTKKPLSAVIAVHGGPYSRITESFNPSYFYFAEMFLHAGYAVMHPNYRGSSGRGESFADKARAGVGIYDEPDVIALTQHCIEKGYINGNELAIQGWSQGGFLSYLCAVRNGLHEFGWKFKAAIPGAGVTDWTTMSLSSDVGFVQAQFTGIAAWASDKDETRDRTGSAIWELRNAAEKSIVPPVLMLHGEKDKRVPIEQARAFRRGLMYHKLPFEYAEYPREGHFIQERKHLEDMLMRAVRFIDQHLTKN